MNRTLLILVAAVAVVGIAVGWWYSTGTAPVIDTPDPAVETVPDTAPEADPVPAPEVVPEPEVMPEPEAMPAPDEAPVLDAPAEPTPPLEAPEQEQEPLLAD